MLKRTTVREIRGSFSRFLAILAIVALGVGFFSGLKVTKPFMVATADQYVKDQNLFDLRLLSTLGFVQEDVDAFAREEGVKAACGSYSYDILCTGIDENETALKVHSLTDGVNGVVLKAGRMPENEKECLADSRLVGEEQLGTSLFLTDSNEADTLDVFSEREYTIVGIVDAVYYMNFERGTTSLGNGRVAGFLYLLPEAFDSEYYTEVFIKLDHGYEIHSEEYEDFMEEMTGRWEEICKGRLDVRYGDLLSEANGKLADAEEEFRTQKADGERELSEANQKLADAREEIAKGEEEINSAKGELALKEAELNGQEAQLSAKEEELSAQEAQLGVKEEELNAQEAQLGAREEELNAQEAQLDAQEAELNGQEAQLNAREAQLKELEVLPAGSAEQIAAGREQIASAKGEIASGREQIASAKGEIAAAKEQIAAGRGQIASAREETASARRQLYAGRAEIQEGKDALGKAGEELSKKEKELEEARKEAERGLSDYEEARREFEEKIAEGEEELAGARADVDAIGEPESYVMGRDTNIGYVCFESDADIVEGIADIFPVFFFMVAALVCITTMNRMVEEQRGQIGVLKALGYSEAAVMGKYMFYSGSAALTGCVAGYLGGTWAFPKVIWEAYGIMYAMPALVYRFDGKLELLSIAVSLLCSIGATWFSCRYELLETAARLMRPKSPKAGKRVFLERIPFIWKRLKFLHKVSVRNIFRYKKRFFMMIIGISGCTALLVTGLGLKDSVTDLAVQQFGEIQILDGSVSLKEDADTGEGSEIGEALTRLTDSFTFVCEESWDLISDGGVKTVNLVILREPEEIGDYLNMHTVKDEPLSYPGEGEAVISHKIADMYGIGVGDEIRIRGEDMREITVTVSGIFENFVYNYVYIAKETYASAMGEEPGYRTLYVNYREGQDIHEAAAAMMKLDGVSAVSVNQDVMERFDNMMSSMNYVVLLVIFSAGALAFIVLYNLTNINITERIREIATIKVLGFYRKETSSYVFRENMVLTAIGACIGLVLGYFLHGFVMGRVNVDMVAFDVHIRPVSYVLSIVLTFLFHFLVNGVMSFKLEGINMAESLKSVD